MAIAFVGAWAGVQGNNVTTLATATRTSTAGNFIAVGITIATPSTNFTSITDSKSNAWLQAAPASGWYNGGGGDSSRLHYAQNISGGTLHTITLTMSTGSFVTIQAAEYSGLALAGALDQIAHGSVVGTGLTLDSTATPTTDEADELLIGFGCQRMSSGTLTWTAGASYTVRCSTTDASSGSTGALEDRIVAATGAYNATMSDSGGTGPGGWDMLIATFGTIGAVPAPGGVSTGVGMQRPVARGRV